jgi:hypothetical protein
VSARVFRGALVWLAPVAVAASVMGTPACEGVSNSVAYGEPIRVRGGQFVRGDLPAAGSGDRKVTAIQTLNPVISPGEGGKSLSGRATGDAASIAFRFADLGSGYWVIPIGAPDPQYPGELTWSVAVDFDLGAPAGMHELRGGAIGADGVAGEASEQDFCVASRIPDNLNACESTLPPPEAVMTLEWDADVDLDLHVLTPEGRDVSPKHPLTIPVDAGVRPSPIDPLIDRDSVVACAADGRRQESLIFPARPEGTWSVYANLFDACGKPSVRFTFRVHEPEGEGKDRHLVQTFERSGRLVDLDANGDAKPGLFVVQYPFD